MVEPVIFELDGNIPPKKNRPRIFKRGNTYIRLPSKAHEKWHQNASLQMNFQIITAREKGVVFPINKCDNIEVHLFYGTRAVKDNTNTVESVHDLLVDSGVLSDDEWKVTGETRQIPHYRKGSPGCKIIIQPSNKPEDGIVGESVGDN